MNFIWICGYCDRRLGAKDKTYGLGRDIIEDLKDRPLRPEVCGSCYKTKVVPQLPYNDSVADLQKLSGHLAYCDNLLTSYGLPENKTPAEKIVILAEAYSLLLAQSNRGRQYYFELAAKLDTASNQLMQAVKAEAGIE